MVSLFILIVCVVLLGWVTVWVLRTLAPGHPALIDNIIWVVVVIVILLILARAFGLSDVSVPQL